MGNWNGFESVEWEFDGKLATVIFPEKANADRKWIFKTEYLNAFPAFEIEMLKRGYHIVNIENQTRWCLDTDTERQAQFARFVVEKYALHPQCAVVGLSCGGMQAVYLSAKHPALVAAIYLDAPVLNLLSCPGGVGHSTNEMYLEFHAATGLTLSDLINYRKHPIDYADALIEAKLPLFLVCGDSDNVVPYVENGYVLAQKYEASGLPFEKVVKSGCGHHPHGLGDCADIIAFVEKQYGGASWN